MKSDFKKMLYDNKNDSTLWERLVYGKLWPVFEPFFKVIDFYHMIAERTKRSWAYAKFGWKNYDFDSAYAFDLLLFKLKRIRKACIDEGIHVVKKEEKQSLDLCIKLLDRIVNHRYGETFQKAHDEKWGELDVSSTPYTFDAKGKPLTHKVHFNRPNIKTPEDEEQERKEHRIIWEMEDKLYKQDVKKLFAIFDKYHRLWWD